MLQGSEELRLFLTAPGDLAACGPWQRMLQRPTPMDTLLGIRRAEPHSNQNSSNSNSTSSSTATATDPAGGSSSSSSAAVSGAGVGGWGVMSRVRHSLLNVVQPKAQPELSAEEQQLRQAKEWFK